MIHRIRIQNFKSLLDVTIEMPQVTVLVGRSGTGKSNFVESIRTLRDILSSQRGLQELQKSWASTRPAIECEAPLAFDVEFSITGIPDRFRYRLTLGQKSLQQIEEESLTLGNDSLFHQATGEWVKEPELHNVPAAGAPALGRIPSIPEVVVAFTALTSGIGCYVFPDDVLAGRGTASGPGLDDQATNYLSTLKDIVSNLQDLHLRKSIVSSLQQVNPTVSSVELNDIQNPDHVVVGHRFNGKTLSLQLDQESDGFRRFYAHLLALYQRPPKQTLLFEHPEDGIHPGALSLLADEFKAAPKDGRGQVILTTHSPRLLDHFDADQIHVVELDGFETRIGPVSAEQRDALRDDLLDAGELLTTDPARLDRENAADTTDAMEPAES